LVEKDLNYLRRGEAILKWLDSKPTALLDLATDVLTGDAEPHMKSERAPATNRMDQRKIYQLTGENFLDAVEKKHVLVSYYAPWCGHCKKLEPTYKELAAKYLCLCGSLRCRTQPSVCVGVDRSGVFLFDFASGEV